MNNSLKHSSQQHFDYLVIGGGISGAAAAYELATVGSVALLEAEPIPGYHSTGRSAAMYTPNYGSPIVRKIITSALHFLNAPPDKFCSQPLLTPRGSLTLATPDSEHILQELLLRSGPGHVIKTISIADALAMAQVIRPNRMVAAVYEEDVKDIDVALLHKSFLSGLKRRGGVVQCDALISKMRRQKNDWIVSVGELALSASIVINAAGAWADKIGELAGAKSIGLIPKRRTGIIVDAPLGSDPRSMPGIDIAGETAYLKPDGGRIMASPGDEMPMEPHDAQPDDLDIAKLVEWLHDETNIEVRRKPHSWAGLRSFVADRNPVVGFDPIAPDFFWLAGQGGYGIMMSQVLGLAAKELIVNGVLPANLKNAGVCKKDISPNREVLTNLQHGL